MQSLMEVFYQYVGSLVPQNYKSREAVQQTIETFAYLFILILPVCRFLYHNGVAFSCFVQMQRKI